MDELITDHVFRPAQNAGAPTENAGMRGTGRVPRGTCVWLGTCAKLPAEHVSPAEFQAGRRR